LWIIIGMSRQLFLASGAHDYPELESTHKISLGNWTAKSFGPPYGPEGLATLEMGIGRPIPVRIMVSRLDMMTRWAIAQRIAEWFGTLSALVDFRNTCLSTM
jgi:hypothetical protein